LIYYYSMQLFLVCFDVIVVRCIFVYKLKKCLAFTTAISQDYFFSRHCNYESASVIIWLRNSSWSGKTPGQQSNCISSTVFSGRSLWSKPYKMPLATTYALWPINKSVKVSRDFRWKGATRTVDPERMLLVASGKLLVACCCCYCCCLAQ